MGLKMGAIERSRRVDSQAWCFFFSTQKIRDARAPQSRTFRGKLRIFLAGMRYLRQCLSLLFIIVPSPAGRSNCARLCEEMGIARHLFSFL